MSRQPIPTQTFVLAIVHHHDRYLLVQELDGSWYVPAGRVEPGETLIEAIQRETKEEAGISIKPTGIIRFQYTPIGATSRLRVIFLAEADDGAQLKTMADEHTLQASWWSSAELHQLRLRGDEVQEMIEYVAAGGVVAPLAIHSMEGRID